MTRAKRIVLRGTAERHAEALKKLAAPGDAVLVVRGITRSAAIMCPDGCGEVISVNLDERAGPAWRIYVRDGQLTLYPSVWRKSGCEAHFILWRDRLLWCDGSDEARWDDDEGKRQILDALPPPDAEPIHFQRLAERLDMIPWECLWSCHALENAGLLQSFERRSKFCRAAGPRVF